VLPLFRITYLGICMIYVWTSAVVDHLDWASDGRRISVVKKKRTVHVFSGNPYGGVADEQSNIKGRVSDLPSLVTHFLHIASLAF